MLALVLGTGGCNRAATATDTQEAREHARDAAARLADGWLMTKVQAQYFADEDVRARDIAVSVTNGVVELTGRVPDENAHTQAVQIARNTDGVRSVVDELVVAPDIAAVLPEPPPAPVATAGAPVPDFSAHPLPRFEDAQITSMIQSKYFLDDLLKGRRIDVDTVGGAVTLRGEVATDGEREQAERIARATQGVQEVENALVVNGNLAATSTFPGIAQPSGDEVITTTIQAQFFLDPDVKSAGMHVTTANGVVVLEGTVPTESAKTRAVEIARATPGVSQVMDRLQVGTRGPEASVNSAAPGGR